MRALVQRVSHASVTVDSQTIAVIDAGLLVMLGVAVGDDQPDIEWLTRKIANMRVLSDEQGVMNRSLIDVGGSVLAISQFTLHASTRKGNRPSWSAAADPATAKPLFDAFVADLARVLGRPVSAGVFGADMAVTLCNDGPVTLLLDSKV
ncbi:MAG: D-aminoacyl-tRNA deacylase, partial [Betaproteobacteria bacterium]